MANQENVHKSWDTALWFSLATILVTFIIIKGCSSDTTPTALAESPNTETIASAGTTPESIKVKLPDGTELGAYKGGIEDKLVAYLNSTAATDSISKSRWFDFDNLNFKTGSAEITEASMKQVGCRG